VVRVFGCQRIKSSTGRRQGANVERLPGDGVNFANGDSSDVKGGRLAIGHFLMWWRVMLKMRAADNALPDVFIVARVLL
jgi:hypothetical protein